jgi:methionyl-tRNA formyltransferase
MKIGPVDSLIFFGGGSSLVDYAKESIKRGIKTSVFAVTRHLEEIVDTENNLTLHEVMEKEKIAFFHIADINNSPELKSIITEKTIGLGIGEVYTFSKETINLFNGKLYDFMVIRLPQYRGGAHFTWQILRKSRLGCWNIQKINEEMVPGVYDSGEILKRREYVIPIWARIPKDYFKVANEEGMKLFIEFIDEIHKGKNFEPVKIQESFGSYFPRLHTINNGYINWSWTVDELERFICAFDEPYAGASTLLNGKRFFFKNCQADYTEGIFHPFLSGLIYRIYNNSVFVAARDGALIIQNVSDESGNDMISQLKTGQRFYTPSKKLEEAMLFNAEYGTEGLIKKVRD